MSQDKMIEFTPFKKIPRLSREIIITEKIDGTNASIYIGENGEFLTASRTRWITPENDNYGFSAWANKNKEELLKLGSGHHFGEWWGQGIQRNYGEKEKIFSLFNVHKWADDSIRPSCCRIVPVLAEGVFDTNLIENTLAGLRTLGSIASPGFTKPEGIIIYHKASGYLFKKTVEKDEEHKFQHKEEL
jgi:hypothetical protein